MKIENRPVFVAYDGKEFKTKEECAKYERHSTTGPLVGLRSDAIERAIAGELPKLADAIERVASLIIRARHQRGEFKKPTKAERAAAAIASDIKEGREDAVL